MRKLVSIACVVLFLCICTLSEARINQGTNLNSRSIKEAKRDSCPNYCSGHGICNDDGTCTCDIGFIGTDCSLEITPLNGSLVTGGVLMFGWNYFSLVVSYSGRAVVVNVTQTSSGDCDLYIKAGSLPNRNTYDARDISTKSSFVVTVPSAQVATYYIGVYGFQSCDYTMLAQVTNGCPNSCSGHGTCLNGQCLCNNGYGGSDCSNTLNDLVVGTVVSGNVGNGEMKNYRLHVTTGNAVNVSLTQTSNSGDCDLYIKYNQEPSIWSWDYANVTLHNHSVIFIEDVRQGYYYIGVYGFSGCNYELLVTVSTLCPNKCSFRGTCSQDNLGCQCNAGYSGDYCQNKTTSLVDGNTVTGYVENHLWNYYTFQSDSDDNMVISIDQLNSGGDCDIYVKANAVPTTFNYDHKETSTNEHFTLTIEDPGRTWWTIGVYGWAMCNYTLTIGEGSACPGNCNGHGTCTANGECVCYAGYSGEACDALSTTLSNGVAVSGHSVAANEWAFFTFSVVNSVTAHIQVKELSSTGYLYVFVAKTTPTLRSYLYSDVTLENIHRINIDLQQSVTDNYIIGVYGNPFSIGERVPFSIVAWSAPNF